MTAYQVLARRFRPQRFDDLVGQEVVVRTLRHALEARQVGHAYLFSGLRGVGKTTVARLLAKALNCDHGPTPDPCGECVPCTEIATGSSLDVLEIDAASNRGIDDVRELREVARVLPVRDRYRVFIVDEAHQLTEAAFNALLKILEEPPAHVVFVLASTDKHKFPATILSRCLQLDFRPIAADQIIARLESVAASDGFSLTTAAAHMIARAAQGSLRDALSLLDRVRAFAADRVDERAVADVLGLPPFETLLALWQALERGDPAAAVEIVRAEDHLGHDPRTLYDELVELLNGLLLLACDPKAPAPFPAEHRQALLESAAALGVPLLLRLEALALEQQNLVTYADRPAVAVAVAVGRLALWPRLKRVEALLAEGQEPSGPSTAGGGPGQSAPPARRTQKPTPPVTATPAGATAERLVAALVEDGEQLLAGRVRAARDVTVSDGVLTIELAAASAASVQKLRDAGERLAAAAVKAGLPAKVQIAEVTAGRTAGPPDIRERVEADESVRAVLEIFGGRIERVEEKP